MKPKLSEGITKTIFSVLPESPLKAAFNFMKEKRIRHLLVVDAHQRVVGVISDRDFYRALETSVEKTDLLKIVSEHFNPAHQVQDFMTWELVTVKADYNVKEAAHLMLEKKVSSVLVVDGAGFVSGIITSDDLLWILIRLLDEEDTPLLETLKAQVMSSPLGFLANSLSQSGL